MKKADGFANETLFVIPREWIKSVESSGLFGFLRVTDIGYFPRAQHHYRDREDGCDTAILLYCRDGCGSFRTGAKPETPLNAYQAVLIPPNTPHTYSASGENPWSVYWVHLSGEALAPYIKMTGESSPVNIPAFLDGEMVREFNRCFEILKTPYQTEEYFLVCQTAGSILALVSAAEKQNRRMLTEKGEDAVEKCIRFMKTNLTKPFMLEDLAGVAGFSPSHLNVLFKQSTGYTPVKYSLRMKMQAASKDLYFTSKPVKEIAVDYGFSDPYYFSRLFKSIMGVSPAIYREQEKG